MTGLLNAVENESIPMEEIRFGVILNGGVSLAVWMGGVVLELNQLTRQSPAETPLGQSPVATGVYSALLALAGSTARADVIAGTSAGGINGAALALCQVNPDARLGLLRDMWVDHGRIEALMRQPFRGSPTSLLQGDEFFLPQLNNALGLLAKPGETWRSPKQAPIDLSITATVLNGNQLVTVDSMGQSLRQSTHGARFHWERLPTTSPTSDPFDVGSIERTCDRLALAARCTASFPVAFEPSFVPVYSAKHVEPPAGAALTEVQRLRPDMGGVAKDWGNDGQLRDRSRFAVDGGLLANTPTRPALKAVEAMPASGPVRRVMLLVFPHAEAPGADPADNQATPPTVTGAVGGILGALMAQGGRTFVEELEEHNKLAAGRRGTRSDVLRSSRSAQKDPSVEIESLVEALYPHYCRLRRWRAGRDLARRAVARQVGGDGLSTPLPVGWNYERVRHAAENAQDQWQEEWRRPIPYYSDEPPTLGTNEPDRGWRWGVTAAMGVAEAGSDLLRRLIWVTKGDDYRTVHGARARISTLGGLIHNSRELTDDIWETPLLASLQPNESYWSMRLGYYERLMTQQEDGSDLRHLIEEVAHKEAVLQVSAAAGPDSPERAAEIQSAETRLVDELTPLLIPDTVAPISAGDVVLRYVLGVVAALEPVLPILEKYHNTHAGAETDSDTEDLLLWRDVLIPNGEPLSGDHLLTRLLQIEIAATTLGDEITTGATLPVELTQLSAQSPNAFAQYSRTGDDKLGGMSVSRFGGFLKRSWRVNDWMWGRIDAASHLCRVVLQPARVRRTALLTGYLSTVRDPDAAARETVTEIVDRFLPGFREDSRIRDLQREAERELSPVLDAAVPPEDLGASLPALADLFAWALHLEIVPSELPALAGAVRADGVEGANARSHGEVFLKEHELLLGRLDPHVRDAPANLSAQDRASALEAFDRAGIGREPLQQEGTSDQMIRTATTAAAVATTVVDSEQSGFTAIRPVTRGLRGVMLLPFWVVTGLTGKGVLGRSFSLLALAVGAVLLSLSLFGALPKGLAGPGAALGAGAVLAALAIGALRSGTMLHGLVLLTPVVPLIAFAAKGALVGTGRSGSAESAVVGVSSLVVVLALAASLMLLGSLPATTGSVLVTLDRLADRRNIRPAEHFRTRNKRWARILRRTYGLAESVALVAAVLGVGAAIVAFVVLRGDDIWDATVRLVAHNGWWSLTFALLAVAAGAALSYLLGLQLQVLSRSGTTQVKWGFQRLTHPAGAAAGWAVVYGALYLVMAAVLILKWKDGLADEWEWLRVLPMTALVLGLLLVLVVPVWLPLRAMLRIANGEVRRALEVDTVPLPSDLQPPDNPDLASRQATAWGMVAPGGGYRGFVRPPSLDRPYLILRKPMGTSVHSRIQKEKARLGQDHTAVLEREARRRAEEKQRMEAECNYSI